MGDMKEQVCVCVCVCGYVYVNKNHENSLLNKINKSQFSASQFHNKKGGVNADDYSMPHTWINLSFYSSKKKIGYGTFIPRIKLPPEKPKASRRERPDCLSSAPCMKPALQDTALPNSIFDYDTYDAQVFKLPSSHNNKWVLG